MSLREKQQMNLDTERATHTGMECSSRASQKHLLLQVWCGLLTVAIVVMAGLLTSIKLKSTEDEVSTLKPDVRPTGDTFMAPLKAVGSSFSYIQLIMSADGHSWQVSYGCDPCSLILHENSIYSTRDSLYFFYAYVTFRGDNTKNQKRSVTLIKNASPGKKKKILVEGSSQNTLEDSVWVAKIVNFKDQGSISLNITGEFLQDSSLTFWGAYQLHLH